MTLEEYAEQLEGRIENFVDHWRDSQALAKEGGDSGLWPDEMDEDEWDDQFLASTWGIA